MSEMVSTLSVTAIALLPVGATAYFGYRYGYRQQIKIAGFVWRAALLSVALSWSLVGGTSHDVGWALIVPNLLVAVLTGFAGAGGGVQVLPPLWIAPLAHLLVFAGAVVYGYRSREREYSKFPPS
ncbi:hypothetical protein ABIE09_001176 [Lysobacter enzymogenes]